MFRTADYGLNWDSVYSHQPHSSVNAFLVSDTFILATRGSSVVRSLDRGETWALINNGLPDTYTYTELAKFGDILFVDSSIHSVVYPSLEYFLIVLFAFF